MKKESNNYIIIVTDLFYWFMKIYSIVVAKKNILWPKDLTLARAKRQILAALSFWNCLLAIFLFLYQLIPTRYDMFLFFLILFRFKSCSVVFLFWRPLAAWIFRGLISAMLWNSHKTASRGGRGMAGYLENGQPFV